MSLRNKGEIYLIKGPKCYIGQAVCYKGKAVWGAEKRFAHHLSLALAGSNGCPALYNAIRKYGPESFSVKVIMLCDRPQLNYFETKFIRQYGCQAPKGYNLEKGGGNLLARHADTIERMRVASTGNRNPNFGIPRSAEVRAKISAANKGKIRTEEMRRRMSELKIGTGKTEECKEKARKTNLEKYGVEHASQSEELKQKYRDTCFEKYGAAHPMQNKDFAKAAGAAKVGFRRNPDYADLPRYVYRMYQKNKKDGYEVKNHPTLKRKSFAALSRDLAENLELAELYLKSTENDSVLKT